MNPRILILTTSPLALWAFFRPQIRFLADNGFDLHAASSPGPLLDEFRNNTPATVHALPMARRLSPLRDLAALLALCRLIRRLRPAIVHAHTPKAGLLGIAAAALARVPVRLYTLHGLPLETRRGPMRILLALAERLTCRLATRVFAVSPSLRAAAARERIAPLASIEVLGDGSCAGVDLERFAPAPPSPTPALLYAGRLVHDKGLATLARAWISLRAAFPTLELHLAGPPEREDPLDSATLAILRGDPRVRFHGFLADLRPLYAAAGICVLPSLREGMPLFALECAAMARPMVATRVTGCVDAVVDGLTGFLVQPRDPAALARAISSLAGDAALRQRMGAAARRRVEAKFDQDRVNRLLLARYRLLLAARRTAPASLARRAADILVALGALVAVSPLLALAALAIRAFMGRPVLFRQARAGLHERVFQILKFRTMDNRGHSPPLGRLLRATSIDELPQLWNVLRGDMTLIGPRPLMAGYLSRYGEFERRRHHVKPGLTGWAQVNGRNRTSWDERFARDVWYVDHRSFALDLRILALTAWQLLRPAPAAPMPEFRGAAEDPLP